MTAFIVIGSILAYLAAGAVYARSQAVAAFRRAKAKWKAEKYVQESLRMQLAWRVLFWPVAIGIDIAVRGVAPWIAAPIDARKAAARQARDDARMWREKRQVGTAAEQLMADQLARMCDQRAEELDL